MAQDKVFTDGLICKEHLWQDGGRTVKLSVKVDEFIAFLQANAKNGWVNINVNQSRDRTKLYGELDTWEPKPQGNGPAQSSPQQQQTPQQEQRNYGQQYQPGPAPATGGDDIPY